MSNYSSQNRYAGNCSAPPLPEITQTSGSCVTELPGKCIDLEVEQGASFSHTILIPNEAKGIAYASSYMPGAAGAATITLSSDSHSFDTGDCIYIYGVCPGTPGYGVVGGSYTVIAAAGAVLSIAEELVGTPSTAVNFLSASSGLCSTVGSLPVVYAMADLSAAAFEMSVYNRGGASVKYQQLRAVTQAGSNQIQVCPKGKVCLYDCVSIPSMGINNAQVSDVFPSNGYDVIHLRDQTATQTADCSELYGGSGKITSFMVDMTKAACGSITFYLNPDATVVGTDEFLGTNDFQESACYKPMKGDCGQMFEIGHFSIKMIALDPASAQTKHAYLQHGKLIGKSFAPACASF